MTEGIEVTVAAGAPMLLPGRRGPSPTFSQADIIVQATVPEAERGEFSELWTVGGVPFATRGGRLWRPVEVQRRFDDPPTTIRAAALERAVAGLGGRGHDEVIRRQLDPLFLDPHHVQNRYGHWSEWPVPPKTPPGERGVAPLLDLREEAYGAVARRVACDLAHDGSRMWVAVAPPELVAGPKATVRYRLDPLWKGHDMDFPCRPDAVELHLAFLARNRFRKGGQGGYPDRLRAAAEELLAETDGIRRPLFAEVELFVRRYAAVTYHAAGAHFMVGERREGLRERRDALMPIAARAAAGLLGDEALYEAVTAIADTARATLVGAQWREAPQVHSTLTEVVDYVEEVALPLLARRPVVAADIDAFDSLGAPGR